MDTYQLFIISAFIVCLCLVSIIHLYFRLFSLEKRKQSEIESIIRDFKTMFEIQNDLLSKIINNKETNSISTQTPVVQQNTTPVIVDEIKETTIPSKATELTLSETIAAFRKNK